MDWSAADLPGCGGRRSSAPQYALSSSRNFAVLFVGGRQPTRSNRLFKSSLILETVEIAPKGRSCPVNSIVEISEDGLSRANVALDANLVPAACAADVANRYAMLLCPEEWNRVKWLAVTEHVRRNHFSLALRNGPMLDPDWLAR